MYIQRQRAILLEVCKLQLNIGPTYQQTSGWFERVVHSYDIRINGKVLQPSKCYVTTYGLKSFRYEGAKIRNEVCDTSNDFKTIADFKAAVVKWEGIKYGCSQWFKLYFMCLREM